MRKIENSERIVTNIKTTRFKPYVVDGKVLTDQSYHRVGGQRPIKVDVRVLSATARNLSDEIAAGRFREDSALPGRSPSPSGRL